jgi:hypothetical protein
VANEPKAKRTKAPKPFWVLTESDGLLTRHYSGPDRGKAREKAAELLQDAKEKVIVVKLATIKVLSADSLEATLPKDSF